VGVNQDFPLWERIRSFTLWERISRRLFAIPQSSPTKKAPEGAAGTTPQEAAKSLIRRNQYLGIRLNTLDYGSNCHIVN